MIAKEIAPAVTARDQPKASSIATKKTPKVPCKPSAYGDMQKREGDQAVAANRR